VPPAVRREAFRAARAAIRDYLAAAGYRVDDIGELEVMDAELRRIVEGYGEPVGPVHRSRNS
jgi:hypothetical protein